MTFGTAVDAYDSSSENLVASFGLNLVDLVAFSVEGNMLGSDVEEELDTDTVEEIYGCMGEVEDEDEEGLEVVGLEIDLGQNVQSQGLPVFLGQQTQVFHLVYWEVHLFSFPFPFPFLHSLL